MTKVQSSSPKWLHRDVVGLLDRIAAGNCSPSIELLHAYMAASRTTAGNRDRRLYDALRDHFIKKWAMAPNGIKYRLTTLQRKYLRHQLVIRYRATGETWEAAAERASDYLGPWDPTASSTVRDSYAEVQKMLEHDGMTGFCRGLEYEFQIAIYGKDAPPLGSFIEPDFLRGDSDHS